MKVAQGPTTLTEALEDLSRRVPGFLAAAVVGMDGVAIAERPAAGAPSLDVLSASHTTLLKSALAAQAESGGGRPTELILLSERHQLVARLLGRDYFLLLVLNADAHLGRARFETRRAGSLLEVELR